MTGLRWLGLTSSMILAIVSSGCHDSDGSTGMATASQSPATARQALEIAWDPPTANSDGTALSDLAGYNLYYGSNPRTYGQSVAVPGGGVTNYIVENLAPGTYYFAIAAYNSSGIESSISTEVAAIVE